MRAATKRLIHKDMEVVPAIIPQSAKHLRTSVEALNGAASAIQIDLVDGKYAGSASWPFSEDGMTADALALLKELAATHAIEVDLMVEKPESLIVSLQSANVSRIVIHFGSTSSLDEILREKEAAAIGVAIGRSDDPVSLSPYADVIDFVQCMGIAQIGRQGEPFDDRVLAQIKEVRERYPKLPISVDGGVSMFTLPLLKAAGATRFVAGSAIFNAPDPMAAHAELSRLATA